MLSEITLGKIYTTITDSFPEYRHDEHRFVDDILGVLAQDPIRTFGLHKALSSQKLDLKIHREWPLHDFLYGSQEYMVHIGIGRQAAGSFIDSFFDSKDILFRE